METSMPKWLMLTGPRAGWMLLGALLTLFALWCYRQYGKEVAFKMFVRAYEEKAADMETIDALFGGSGRTIICGSESFRHYRYRFAGGGEIDVVTDGEGRILTDKNGNIIGINATFAKDGLGLLGLFHRRQFFTAPVTIPLRKGE